MNFAEKLAALTDGKNKQRLSVEARLPPTAISDYIAKGNVPRADKALALARALGVTLDSLIDDTRECSQEKGNSNAALTLTDEDLMAEVTRRQRLAALDFYAAIEKAREIDWARAAKEASASVGGDMTDYASHALSVLAEIELKHLRAHRDFDPRFYSVFHHRELPGADRPIADFEGGKSSFVFGDFNDREDIDRFARLIAKHPAYARSTAKRQIDAVRQLDRSWQKKRSEST